MVRRENVKKDYDYAIKNHLPDFDDFFSQATDKNNFKFTLMEFLLTNRNGFPLNRNKLSAEMKIFKAL